MKNKVYLQKSEVCPSEPVGRSRANNVVYYVYLLRSKIDTKKTYVGYTTDLQERIERHNAGRSKHTQKYSPWELVMYLVFFNKQKALDFEKYLKIGSGYAFAKKRFWCD